MAEHVAGTHLRTRRDTEWDKGREAVARFLGYAPPELDDLADDLLYALDRQGEDSARMISAPRLRH